MVMRRWVFLLAAALSALIVGGLASATTRDTTSTINACYLKQSGLLRVAGSASQCNATSETPLSWNQRGPRGATGPSDAWEMAADAWVPTNGVDMHLGNKISNIPPGDYLLGGSATTPPLDSGNGSVFCIIELLAGGDGSVANNLGGFETASTLGGGSLAMSGTLRVASGGSASIGVACHATGTAASVPVATRFHALRVGTLHAP